MADSRDQTKGFGEIMPDHPGVSRTTWFARAKFRPATLPASTVSRPALHDQLQAGSRQRLTVVVGPAGSGKSILLSSWAAARPAGLTSWLACDQADVNSVRFWSAFIEAIRVIAPGFGADAADLLAMDRAMSPNVTASIANDAAQLPPGSAVIVDDFHTVSAAVADDMSELIERWPARTSQLVLASRSDPPVPLHRLRLSGELCELGNDELRFSVAESRDLLASFGAELSDDQLALLHRRSEGWATALQIVAQSLRGAEVPAGVTRALAVSRHAISEYLAAEVLDLQPSDVAQFMLDISILGQLTTDSCAALTGRRDAGTLLRALDTAHLFLVPLDDARTRFRYHRLVREALSDELRTRDPLREQALQLQAAEWFESADQTHNAIRCYLAAHRVDRALALTEKRVLPDFLADPVLPRPLDPSMGDPSALADAPDQLLAIAASLLLSGNASRGGQYLDLLEHVGSTILGQPRLRARFMALQSLRHVLIGEADLAVSASLAARSVQERTQQADQWDVAVALILVSAYSWLEDIQAVEREAATALATPSISEPVKLVALPGARAWAAFEFGHLNLARDWARAAEEKARLLGFTRHFFAGDYLRTQAGLALEQRDLKTARELTEQAFSIAEQRRPAAEFLALLDRARVALASGHIREALPAVDAARRVLAGARSVLLARADELEAMIRQSVGDLHAAADLAARLPAAARELMLARIALTAGAHETASEHLRSPALGDLTPRRALVRRLLIAEEAIERGDPAATGIVGGVLETARAEGYLNTIVSTAPRMTSYIVEHLAQMGSDPYTRRLVEVALTVHDSHQGPVKPRDGLIEPLTEAEQHVLRLLPTYSYLQIAATLYVSHNTVKTHVRAIYRKLGVSSRKEAIARALELGLL